MDYSIITAGSVIPALILYIYSIVFRPEWAKDDEMSGSLKRNWFLLQTLAFILASLVAVLFGLVIEAGWNRLPHLIVLSVAVYAFVSTALTDGLFRVADRKMLLLAQVILIVPLYLSWSFFNWVSYASAGIFYLFVTSFMVLRVVRFRRYQKMVEVASQRDPGSEESIPLPRSVFGYADLRAMQVLILMFPMFESFFLSGVLTTSYLLVLTPFVAAFVSKVDKDGNHIRFFKRHIPLVPMMFFSWIIAIFTIFILA